ncbi:MAG TPA: DUF2304 domain-containing protein [Patescibacteria group bacterium]|nr:DUF2304 domain-containing protein [Patescibacteria group bacterium]
MNIKLLAVGISLGLFLTVIELIRRKKMSFKYAVSWLAASALAILFSVFDRLLGACAQMLGFTLPSNFIFFLIGLVTVFLSLLLTVYLYQQTNRIELIAQKLSLVELELSRLTQKNQPDRT